jgi:hypothetical protein
MKTEQKLLIQRMKVLNLIIKATKKTSEYSAKLNALQNTLDGASEEQLTHYERSIAQIIVILGSDL